MSGPGTNCVGRPFTRPLCALFIQNQLHSNNVADDPQSWEAIMAIIDILKTHRTWKAAWVFS